MPDTPDPLAGLDGPPELLARIRNRLATQQATADSAPAPAVDAGTRPSQRHAGIHALLDLLDAAAANGERSVDVTDEDGRTVRLVISRLEEERLRTYGRSGPAVATVLQAVGLLMQWRAWDADEAARHG